MGMPHPAFLPLLQSVACGGDLACHQLTHTPFYWPLPHSPHPQPLSSGLWLNTGPLLSLLLQQLLVVWASRTPYLRKRITWWFVGP